VEILEQASKGVSAACELNRARETFDLLHKAINKAMSGMSRSLGGRVGVAAGRWPSPADWEWIWTSRMSGRPAVR